MRGSTLAGGTHPVRAVTQATTVSRNVYARSMLNQHTQALMSLRVRFIAHHGLRRPLLI